MENFSFQEIMSFRTSCKKGYSEEEAAKLLSEAYRQNLIANNPSTEPSDVVAAFEEGAEWALERVERYIENHVQSVAWLQSIVMSCTKYMLGDKFKERLVDDIRNGKI